MNKPVVIIGVVVLIAGVVVIAVGAVGVLRGLTIITTFNQTQSGEYVSTELMINSTSGIAVESAAANGGLIPAQNLTMVNSTNIGQYALTPHSSVGGTVTYTNVLGNYYYVAFAPAQPSSKVVISPLHGGTLGSSPLVLAGFLVVIIGIVIIVLGARMKSSPNRNRKEETERGRNSGMQNPPAR